MQFTKKLRQPIKQGEVTTSIRIWKKPHVKVGGRYILDEGHIIVTSISEITLADITENYPVTLFLKYTGTAASADTTLPDS